MYRALRVKAFYNCTITNIHTHDNSIRLYWQVSLCCIKCMPNHDGLPQRMIQIASVILHQPCWCLVCFSRSAVVRWCNVSHESYDTIVLCDLPYGVVCVCPLVLKIAITCTTSVGTPYNFFHIGTQFSIDILYNIAV